MKKWLKMWLFKGLFNAVRVRDILTVETQQVTGPNGLPVQKSRILINGQKIDDTEFKVLIEEAKYLQNTKVWRIVIDTLESHAMQLMFDKSKTFDDVVNGKMMLYNISVQRNILELILKGDLSHLKT